MKVPLEWNVIPLKANSKYPPIIKDWQNTKYPREKIREHKGNYAVGTGMISGGLVVFDWDFRRGYKRKENGIKEVYNEFKAKHPKLADTLIVETPHGYHFYYIYKDPEVNNTSQKNVCYDKKKFIAQNSTRFANYLQGLDTRANGGYVVCPPSKVDDGEYKWLQECEPVEITKKEYEQIFEFFALKESEIAKNTIREGFVSILEGKMNPNDIATIDLQEQVYWKEMFHECFKVGLYPTDLYEGLQKFQKGFDLEKTIEQLKNKKNIEYIQNGKRLSKEKYEKYFHMLQPQVKPLTPMNFQPSNSIVIPYDNNEIHIFDNYVNFVKIYPKNIKIEKILDCSFEIFRKCYHKKEERFSYVLNDKTFYTDTILDILHRAEPYLRKGLKGRDCLKEVISYYSSQLNTTKPREFLGFDNGWILPLTEDEKDFSIVVITDYQQEAYSNAQKIIKEYTPETKEKICELLKEFIRTTQCEAINLFILMGWTLAAPFRLYFIREYDLFPILYNYGPPNTGRSTLEDFWIIDFYGIYNNHLPPNTSIARLEDHLSKSTFPYSLQDIKESIMYNNRDLISMLQDYSTSVGLFERKKGSKEIEFIKYKIAGLNLDSNEILEMFSSPAINERQVFCQYTQKIVVDLNWIKLRKKLKKYKLFSLIYDYTKDWDNEELDELFAPILEDFNSTFKTNSSRLLKSAAIIRFGIDLFQNVFKMKLGITNDDIMNGIIQGSSKMTEYIVDQFREFCLLAMNFDESYMYVKEYASGDAYETFHRGENPSYIHHKLKLDSDKEYFAYTSSNHEDYKKRFGEKCGMKALVEKVQKGLSVEEMKLIEYTSARPFLSNGVKCKPMGVVKIAPEFFNVNVKDKKEVEGNDLVLNWLDVDKKMRSEHGK